MYFLILFAMLGLSDPFFKVSLLVQERWDWGFDLLSNKSLTRRNLQLLSPEDSSWAKTPGPGFVLQCSSQLLYVSKHESKWNLLVHISKYTMDIKSLHTSVKMAGFCELKIKVVHLDFKLKMKELQLEGLFEKYIKNKKGYYNLVA